MEVPCRYMKTWGPASIPTFMTWSSTQSFDICSAVDLDSCCRSLGYIIRWLCHYALISGQDSASTSVIKWGSASKSAGDLALNPSSRDCCCCNPSNEFGLNPHVPTWSARDPIEPLGTRALFLPRLCQFDTTRDFFGCLVACDVLLKFTATDVRMLWCTDVMA